MSLASETRRNDYTGTGLVAIYPYTFKIFSKADLSVKVRDLSNIETPLVLDVDYTVSGVGETAGGNVTLLAGSLASGFKLAIRRSRPLTQLTDIRNQGDFFPETIEDEFDALVMLDQQQQDQIDRSVKLPDTVPASSFDPTLPATIVSSPGAALVVNVSGTGLALGSGGAGGFLRATYASLRSTALLAPNLAFVAYATDISAWVAYSGDPTTDDGTGWRGL